MDKVKHVCIDSIYKSFDSVSNSDLKYEITESIDIADNTTCYIDGISIPHTWYTIDNYNNHLFIETTNYDLTLSASDSYGKLHSIWVSNCFKLLYCKPDFLNMVVHVIITTM